MMLTFTTRLTALDLFTPFLINTLTSDFTISGPSTERRLNHPHPGLIIAEQYFDSRNPPLVTEFQFLSLETMDLLNEYAYPSLSGYAKFTITMTVMPDRKVNEFTSTIGPAIPLTYQDSSLIPLERVYSPVYDTLDKFAEKYVEALVLSIMIRVYTVGKRQYISMEERKSIVSRLMNAELTKIDPIP